MTQQQALDGTALFRTSPTFLKGVVAIDGLPPADRPEIAFAGRSNVGKSSLINALTNRKNLARTSNTPGRTQELNFFNFETMNAYLVDMPGYGYAQAPKDLVKGWTNLIKSYLPGRPSLRRTYLLIDSRHGIKANDEEMMKLLDTNAVSFQVVLTKIDKLKAGALEKVHERSAELLKKHPAALPNIINTSSQKNIGIDELRDDIAITLS